MKRSFRWVDQPLAVQFLGAGIIVSIVSMIALGLIFSQVRSQIDSAQWQAQHYRKLGFLDLLSRDLFRQKEAWSQYIGTKSLDSQNRLQRYRESWQRNFNSLQRESAAPAELARLYRVWTENSDQLATVMQKPSSQELKWQEGLFKQVFQILEHTILNEEGASAQMAESERRSTGKTLFAIAGANIFLFCTFSFLLLLLYWSIAHPIAVVSRGINQYREGDLKSRVPVTTKSEIGLMAFGFNEAADRIESMVRELKEYDQVKSEFLSAVSHELRTPLTSIRGYLKIMLSGDSGPVSAIQSDFLKTMDKSAFHLNQLIDDLLDVEKIESGRIQLSYRRFNLRELITECVQPMAVLAESKGLTLTHEEKGDISMEGDRNRLMQLFTNLISNAIKYTLKGEIRIKSFLQDDHAWVKIIDTGIGMAAEEQGFLFEKFYRAPSGMEIGQQGTGLGLAIVRGIAQAHGGVVSVESERGRGTTFNVILPLRGPA